MLAYLSVAVKAGPQSRSVLPIVLIEMIKRARPAATALGYTDDGPYGLKGNPEINQVSHDLINSEELLL
ncbi:MAG: hypothetical protein LQ337_004712 [Flavoplaca oasis]|nr:MAG: hypothetical protein LQ337_004712 [Flavoplaca oasis]